MLIALKDFMLPVHSTLRLEDTLENAIRKLWQTKGTILPVVDNDGLLVGVFTRSIMYRLILDEVPLSTPIQAFVKRDVRTDPVETTYTMDELERLVKMSDVSTSVVVDRHRKPVGLVTQIGLIYALFTATRSYKEQLETILQSSQLGVVMTDEHKQIVFANDRFMKMMERYTETYIHQRIDDLFPNIDFNFSKSVFLKQVQIGTRQTMARISRYQTLSGKDGIIALFQDTSDVEKMAQELQSIRKLKQILSTAIENDSDGLIMINENSDITMVNQPLLDLFSLRREDILGMPVNNVLPQLQLTKVMKTKEADLSDFMEINGIKYLVNRIPISQDGKIIGVLGKVVFRQLHQVRHLFKQLEKEESTAKPQVKLSRFTLDDIVSANPHMEKIKKSIYKAARGSSTILIRGESGTGKELFAHAIHNASFRRDNPFVVVNCAAIPEHLLESEFFGYEEGAFTGASQKGKIGKFELANTGTLFLDEIGDMSLPLQAKLLRALQEKEFYRVGGTRKIQVDVRIIAATNRPLEEMVKKGLFREDLYYRLNVISITIPPIRERKEDILQLAYHFIQQFNRKLGTSITKVDPGVEEILLLHDWPGNVRELQNVLERAVTFAEHGTVTVEDLPEYLLEATNHRGAITLSSPKKMYQSAELLAIKQALKEAKGNKTKTAELLGISRSGLYKKMKKYENSLF